MNTASILPAVFIGHGSPMNALEDNRYTMAWQEIGKRCPTPTAILMISAHWMTPGEVAVTAMQQPPTIHDFGGFPQALFDMQYPAPGSPQLAAHIQTLLQPLPVRLDQEWGLDHGSWSVLVKMYPEARIPVLQLSLDLAQPARWHYQLGQRLAALRQQGVLLMASGNIVHNLRQMRMNSAGWDWAERFNQAIKSALLSGDDDSVIDYLKFGDDARWSVPTNEHYLPLLYILGSRLPGERVELVCDGMELSSISMTSFRLA